MQQCIFITLKYSRTKKELGCLNLTVEFTIDALVIFIRFMKTLDGIEFPKCVEEFL